VKPKLVNCTSDSSHRKNGREGKKMSSDSRAKTLRTSRVHLLTCLFGKNFLLFACEGIFFLGAPGRRSRRAELGHYCARHSRSPLYITFGSSLASPNPQEKGGSRVESREVINVDESSFHYSRTEIATLLAVGARSHCRPKHDESCQKHDLARL
jgi:hypothetical protein